MKYNRTCFKLFLLCYFYIGEVVMNETSTEGYEAAERNEEATFWPSNCTSAISDNNKIISREEPYLERLQEDILIGYDKALLPVLDHHNKIIVEIGLVYKQVLRFNEKHQVLKSLLWFRMKWKDEFLTWNPDDYNGIKEIQIPQRYLWQPEIAVLEEIGVKNYKPRLQTLEVSYNGTVALSEPSVLETTCKLDVYMFPFDWQACHLTFMPWLNAITNVDLLVDKTIGKIRSDSLMMYTSNGEWDLFDVIVKKSVNDYATTYHSRKDKFVISPWTAATPNALNLSAVTNSMFAELRFIVAIRRRWMMYVQCTLFPCILLLSIALLGFFMPPGSGERIALQVTLLLTFMVFLTSVDLIIPSSTISYLSIFFIICMILLAVDLVMSVFVLETYFKSMNPCAPNSKKLVIQVEENKNLLSKRVCEESTDVVESRNTSPKNPSDILAAGSNLRSHRDILKINNWTQEEKSVKQDINRERKEEEYWKHRAFHFNTICFRAYVLMLVVGFSILTTFALYHVINHTFYQRIENF